MTFSCIHLYSHCVIANKHPDNLNISHDDAPFLHSLHMHVKSVIHSYCYRLACGARVSYTDCKRNVILYCLFFQSSNHTNCNVEAVLVYRLHSCPVMQPLIICLLQPDFLPLLVPYFFCPLLKVWYSNSFSACTLFAEYVLNVSMLSVWVLLAGKPLAVWLCLHFCVLDDLSDTEPLCISRVKPETTENSFWSPLPSW